MRLAIPSVGYGDLLALTLPAWCALAPYASLVVVTATDDAESQGIAQRYSVDCFVTDAWTRRDPTYHVNGRSNRTYSKRWRETMRAGDTPTFNLALALDEAFAETDDAVRGVINADCYPIGVLPQDDQIAADVIYGAWRRDCASRADLDAYLRGQRSLDAYPLVRASGRITQSQHRDVPNVGEGYCQIFRADPRRRFGSYPAADEYDFDFALTFPLGVMLEGLSFLHLGERARNWDGRVTPRWEGVSA